MEIISRNDVHSTLVPRNKSNVYYGVVNPTNADQLIVFRSKKSALKLVGRRGSLKHIAKDPRLGWCKFKEEIYLNNY